MTSTCTLLLVIHVRYDSSTCDIKFLRLNYSPCIKQSSLLKFWKAGFIMKRLITIHWNTLRGVVDLINSDIHTRITLVCYNTTSIHRKQLNKSYCSWNDRITVKRWHGSFPVRKNTINSVKVQLSNENRQQKTYFWITALWFMFHSLSFQSKQPF